MLIKELDGLKRMGEFKGALQLQIPGNPDIWIGEDALASAIRHYSKDVCQPANQPKAETSPISRP